MPSELDGRILALALPAMAALAADPLLGLVDTAFVGHLGAPALAALGVNTSLFGFMFVVFNFLSTATTPLLASALAAGDKEQAGALTLQAGALAGGLGVALCVGLLLGAEPLLALLGAGPETGDMHDLALVYLQYRAVAAPAALLMTSGQGVFRALSDMRTPLAITGAANVVNLALDGALIWGAGWGVGGAAAATSVAEWGAAGAYVALVWARREELGLSPLPRIELGAAAAAQLAPLASAGGAVLARTAVLLGTKTLAAATAAHLGPVPIAAHQVLSQLWVLSSLVVDGLAVAGQTLVAVSLAGGDAAAARAVADRLLAYGAGLGLALAAAFWGAAPLLPGLFSDDPDVAAAVTRLLPLAVGLLPVNALVYVLDGVLVGARDFGFLAAAMSGSAAATVALLLGAEASGAGLDGVWWALGALMAMRLATLSWRYAARDGPLPRRAAETAPVARAGGGEAGDALPAAVPVPVPVRAPLGSGGQRGGRVAAVAPAAPPQPLARPAAPRRSRRALKPGGGRLARGGGGARQRVPAPPARAAAAGGGGARAMAARAGAQGCRSAALMQRGGGTEGAPRGEPVP